MAKTASGPPSTTGTNPVAPRSDTPGATPESNPQPEVTTRGSATVTASPKRGRGRPAKPKPDTKQNDAVSAKKPVGRPKRNQAAPVVPAESVAAAAVRNARVRAKSSNTVPLKAAQVTTTAADGSRKRGRPKKADVAAATVAPVKKRGRKPTTEVAARAKPVRTTRKTSSVVAPVASNVGDVKKKTAVLQKKVKEAAAKLKVAVTTIEEVQKLAAEL